MSIVIPESAAAKFVKWMEIALEYGDSTEELVQCFEFHFPNKASFELALPRLKILSLRALKKEQRDLMEESNKILNKRIKTAEEKELMRIRNKIQIRFVEQSQDLEMNYSHLSPIFLMFHLVMRLFLVKLFYIFFLFFF